MRLTGAAVLVLAGLLAGLSRMLDMLEFELERFKTTLPALFGMLAGQLEGEAGALCRRTAESLTAPDRRPMADIWADATAPLPEAERAILAPLGHVLGRYGADEQRRALESARAAMERAESEAGLALQRNGRMYVGVPAAAAAVLAVLLL